MELLQLKYFSELARQEHLTKVANAMYVSPSAISSSIARLEEELGVKLFNRIGRNIKLNDYGQEYLKHVQNALNELDYGKRKLQDMSSSLEGLLCIATTNPYIWSKPIHDFGNLYPDISFDTMPLEYMGYGPVEIDGRVDLIIASAEGFINPNWDSKILFHDRVALAVPKGHHLAKRKKISLIELKDEWLVNLPKSAFAQFTYDLCAGAGFEPKSRISCDYTMRPRIAKSENMALITSFHCKRLDIFSDMVFIPITDEAAFRNQAVFWKKDRYLSKAASMFIDFLVDMYKDYQPI